jgi:ABC-type anion transport system duplicated permease subunit
MESFIANLSLTQDTKTRKKLILIAISIVGMAFSILLYDLLLKAHADAVTMKVAISSNMKLDKFKNYLDEWETFYWLCRCQYWHEFCNYTTNKYDLRASRLCVTLLLVANSVCTQVVSLSDSKNASW